VGVVAEKGTEMGEKEMLLCERYPFADKPTIPINASSTLKDGHPDTPKATRRKLYPQEKPQRWGKQHSSFHPTFMTLKTNDNSSPHHLPRVLIQRPRILLLGPLNQSKQS